MLCNTESIAELPEYIEKSGILSASGVTDMGQTLAHNITQRDIKEEEDSNIPFPGQASM